MGFAWTKDNFKWTRGRPDRDKQEILEGLLGLTKGAEVAPTAYPISENEIFDETDPLLDQLRRSPNSLAQRNFSPGLLNSRQAEQLAPLFGNKYLSSLAIPLFQQMTGMGGTKENPYAKINPSDYTPESIAAFSRSGNYGLLVPREDPTKKDHGMFSSYKDFVKSQQETRKEADKMLAPSRESLRKYNQATDLLKSRNGFAGMTGADDTVLIKAFASMILPGEAVMSDDISTIANQSGLPGWVRSYASKLAGQGTLGEADRAQIYRAMTDLATRANLENAQIRAMFSSEIEQSGFNPSSIFRDRMEFNPYASSGSTKSGSAPLPIKEDKKKAMDELNELRKLQGVLP